MRVATDAVINTLDLPETARIERLQRVAEKIQYWQTRNAQARTSHTATRKNKIKELGITLSQLRRCHPS